MIASLFKTCQSCVDVFCFSFFCFGYIFFCLRLSVRVGPLRLLWGCVVVVLSWVDLLDIFWLLLWVDMLWRHL